MNTFLHSLAAGMDWAAFWTVLGLLQANIVFQGVAAALDGYFSKGQMRRRGNGGVYALTQHGGVWTNLLVTSPLTAYIVGKYHLLVLSPWSAAELAIILVAWVFLFNEYRKMGAKKGEAHAHDGKTTVAGWALFVYGIPTTWVPSMFFSGLTTSVPAHQDVVLVAIGTITLMIMGVVKFSTEWKPDRTAFGQASGLSVGVALVAAWRLKFF